MQYIAEKMKIHTIIKERREVLRISQNDLANLSGIGLRTIRLIESGKANPSVNTLEKLIDILGMELNIKIKKVSE